MFSEERKAVLKMLDEGKITMEEAETLLDALEEVPQEEQPKEKPSAGKRSVDLDEQIEDFKVGLKDGLSQVKKDIARARDEIEKSPVKEDFSNFIKSLMESISFSAGSGYKFEDVVEGNFAAGAGETVEVEMDTRNGSIFIEPVQGEDYKLIINSTVKADDEEEAKARKEKGLEVSRDGRHLKLRVKERNVFASVQLLLPVHLIYNLNLDSSNGKVKVTGLKVDKAKADTSNGSISFQDLKGSVFHADTSNGRVEMMGLEGEEYIADTSNGSIVIEGKGRIFTCDTSNGSVNLKPSFSHSGEIKVETSNGRIRITLPDEEEKGYKIKARTSMGGIKLNIPNLVYQERSDSFTQKNLVASSENFQDKPVKINIDATTSMGSIFMSRQGFEDDNS